LSIRVCGAETISTVSSTKRQFIFGFAEGDPSSMIAGTRYHSITQSDFESWFTISPSSDPCTIDNYELIVPSLSDIQVIEETQITLSGSLGSFVLKVDRTK